MSKNSFLTLSMFFLLAFGCISRGEYRIPLFVPAYQKKILRTHGQFQTIHSFDCNNDGYSDLLLAGTNDIFCYFGNSEGLEDEPRYQWRFSEIRCFDFVHSAGGKKSRMVVITDKEILYFDDFTSKTDKSVDKIDPDAYFPPLGRLRLFQNLDRDNEPDLVVPFCSRSREGWFARIYSSKDNSIDFQGEIFLGGTQNLFPPKVYLWRNKKILVESDGSLWMYFPGKEGHYPRQPSREIRWENALGEQDRELRLVGIAQLNGEAGPDLVLAHPTGGKMWVWVDQTRLYPLNTPEVLNLGVEFKDCDYDGWNDIVCVALKEISFGEMIPYFASDNVPVTLKIYIFYNDRGRFSSERCRVFEREFWIPIKNTNSGEFSVQVLKDVDNDGLTDGISLDKFGKLRYYYNAFCFCPQQRPVDWFDKLLKPVYTRLVLNHWPRRVPDFAMQLPNQGNCREVSTALLASHGENVSLAFHYRAFAPDGDLLVVVFPNGRVQCPNKRKFCVK